MDLQGTPIGSTNQGLKNTTDPSAKDPTFEGSGAVASDSLAAESTRSGGAFNENRDSEPLGVSGSNSTFNNTDTSGATKLAPAADSSEREAADRRATSDDIKGPGGLKYTEGVGGQGDFPGQHNADGYAGGPTSAKQSTGSGSAAYRTTATSGSTGSTGSSGGVDAAPSYVASVNSVPGSGPHGKNITEGGFDSDPSNNASFTSDIGDENDPGRVAANKFQRQALESGPDAGGSGPRQKGLTGDGQYDTLETDQQL